MTKRKKRLGSLFNPKAAMFAYVLAWGALQTPFAATETTNARQSTRSKLAQTETLQRSALAANPSSPELHGALGQTLLQERKYEEAVQELGLAAQRFPDSPAYNLGVAEALIGWGHFGVAEQLLHAIQPRFDTYAQFHYDLGLAEYSLSQSQDAERELREALRLDPKQERAKLLLAACRAGNGDLSGAVDSLEVLAKNHPNEASYWLALAEALEQMGPSHYHDALRASRHALALEPGDPRIQFDTAVILLKMQDYAAARPLLEDVVKLAPNDSRAHVALASVYSHLGDHASARKESEIIARLAKQESGPAGPAPGQP